MTPSPCRRSASNWTKIFADWTLGGRGLLKGEALQDFINQQVGKRPLEKLNKPFAAVATDLNNGERVVFRTGDTGLAVRASAAVPGVFQPAQFPRPPLCRWRPDQPSAGTGGARDGGRHRHRRHISARPEGQPPSTV